MTNEHHHGHGNCKQEKRIKQLEEEVHDLCQRIDCLRIDFQQHASTKTRDREETKLFGSPGA